MCAARARKQAFVAFHVLNAWEEKVESNTVVKVVTCDYSELNLDPATMARYLTTGGCWVGVGWADGHPVQMQFFLFILSR